MLCRYTVDKIRIVNKTKNLETYLLKIKGSPLIHAYQLLSSGMSLKWQSLEPNFDVSLLL